ncbi:unnamed protein product [Caenorhabditis auriculariae]|uniref:Uncharacterized protein n=1 Tax=Caenorhabditis auriculariae TaxID=2777116 RepID=A0A8S1HCJ9_9PELO|nr:unnamed protein product [Caenorhabditis auriculariae]
MTRTLPFWIQYYYNVYFIPCAIHLIYEIAVLGLAIRVYAENTSNIHMAFYCVLVFCVGLLFVSLATNYMYRSVKTYKFVVGSQVVVIVASLLNVTYILCLLFEIVVAFQDKNVEPCWRLGVHDLVKPENCDSACLEESCEAAVWSLFLQVVVDLAVSVVAVATHGYFFKFSWNFAAQAKAEHVRRKSMAALNLRVNS